MTTHPNIAKQSEELPLWHTLSAATVARNLESDLERGLASDEAARRLEKEGPNEICELRRRNVFAMAVSQFKDLWFWS